MSAYEGSKMQENDEDKKHGFLGHIKNVKEAKEEKEAEDKMFEDFKFKVWLKAQKLEYSDFKGWLKGEGYVISRIEI